MSSEKRRRLAYVLLWFPLASETFIFREVQNMAGQNLDIRAYTMYGESLRGCSNEMRQYGGEVTRFGMAATYRIWRAFWRALRCRPKFVLGLMRQGLWRKMRNLESFGENTWCFMAGFLLAEMCINDKIELIHAPWANGPATAAWVASQLTGIPFAFSGRAGDIYPQDGLLPEKSAAAAFVRTNNAANVKWLEQFCPNGTENKVRLVYNGLTFGVPTPPARKMPRAPYRLLAVGRFARTKGFPQLFTALARLKREKFPVRLTLVGDGSWKNCLRKILRRLQLENDVDLPGFVPNDKLAQYMADHDLLIVPSVVHSNGDRDGIPNVIMEASLMELPVVATDVCGIGEVIIDGRTGRLVPQRDPAALAAAIREQLENYANALKMARAARDQVLSIFDPTQNYARLAALYQQAIAGHSGEKADA